MELMALRTRKGADAARRPGSRRPGCSWLRSKTLRVSALRRDDPSRGLRLLLRRDDLCFERHFALYEIVPHQLLNDDHTDFTSQVLSLRLGRLITFRYTSLTYRRSKSQAIFFGEYSSALARSSFSSL